MLGRLKGSRTETSPRLRPTESLGGKVMRLRSLTTSQLGVRMCSRLELIYHPSQEEKSKLKTSLLSRGRRSKTGLRDYLANGACMKRIWFAHVVIAVGFALTGCGSVTYTRTRTVFEPYAAAEGRQEKDGVVAELKFTRQTPQTFIANAQKCDQVGRLLVDSLGRPIFEPVSLARPGQYWQQLALTNNTTHVLRMTEVVIRLFDPAANQIEPLTWGDLTSELMAMRPCPSSMQAIQQLRINKIFDRNMEIVPHTTATFWLAFRPPSMQMTGTWKFAIYEVPVNVDSAGRPTRTTGFDMRIVAKQIVDKMVQDNPFAPSRLVESKEISDAPAAQQATDGAAQQVPAPRQGALNRSTTQTASPAARVAQPNSESEIQTNARTPSKTTVMRAQVRLKELGFDPGGADGSIGPHTTAAIRKFQALKRLPATGRFTPETLEALSVNIK